jgi:hypothetical protein
VARPGGVEAGGRLDEEGDEKAAETMELKKWGLVVRGPAIS